MVWFLAWSLGGHTVWGPPGGVGSSHISRSNISLFHHPWQSHLEDRQISTCGM